MACNRALALTFIAIFLTAPTAGRAQPHAPEGDWPGWRGRDRTGVSIETGLLKKWPEGGPKVMHSADHLLCPPRELGIEIGKHLSVKELPVDKSE